MDISKLKKIIGTKVKEAIKIAQVIGVKLRVIEKDGKSSIYTCDYQDNRLNVIVKDGVVDNVSHFG